jgi:hypothetical protein
VAGNPPTTRSRARKTKTERKTEVRNALAHNEPVSGAPAEADQLWADRIDEADKLMSTTMADMVNAIISLGKTFLGAKAELGHGNFKAMVEHKTRFKLRTAELYMQIASNAFLSNAQHVATLPPYVSTLGVLAPWKPAALKAAVDKGDVTPELERTRAVELAKEYGPAKAKAVPARPKQQPDPEPPDDDEDDTDDDTATDDGFTAMPDGSGQVKLSRPVADQDQADDGSRDTAVSEDTSQVEAESPTLTRALKAVMTALAQTEHEAARELLLPYGPLIVRILGYEAARND